MEKIGPPHGTSTEVSFPLTFFDIFWLKVEPAQSLFFYHSNELFFDSLLPRLKNSLSLTLKHFLPLAGKLIWSESSPKPFVKYVQGDAVSVTIAESADDFNYLSGNNLREAERFSLLVPHLPVSQETAAVSSIQITLFPNCGFSIGVSTHHAVLDGRSATSFIKSWAHVCRLASFPMELTPIYDRSVMKYPAELDEIYTNLHLEGPSKTRSLSTLESQLPQDSFRGTFVMTRANIEKLRQLVNNEMAKKNQRHQAIHMSSFSLTCALAWLCLVKAQDVSEKKVFLIINADCRSRFEPPIASTYFGNCIRGLAAAAETKMLLGKEGFVVAVNAISEAIKSLENGVLTEAENWDSWIGTWLSEGKVYAIGGSPRFEIYSSDFGWGRPIKAELISIDKTGAISLQDHRDGIGAIQIDLVSKKHHMEAFTSLFAQGIQ